MNLVITVMKRAMYPIDHCVDLAKEEQRWLIDLKSDPVYAHTVLYVAQVYFDVIKSQILGPTAIVHTNKTIARLQRQLAEANLEITDSTIFTVLALAMASASQNDLEAAKKHLHGLSQLIKLRGGMPALNQKWSLQIKCLRFVLSYQNKHTCR